MSLLLYLSTFVVSIICGNLTGQDMSSMNTISDSMWIVGMISAPLLTAIFTYWYFCTKDFKASAEQGFFFGITATIISTILDLLLFSAGNANGANVDMMKYYGDFRFWVILLMVIAVSSAVGWFKVKRK